MAVTKEIVVLANSIRGGDRCIAGKELIQKEDQTYEIGRWIRLADHSTKEGAVPNQIAYCPDHGWVKTLNVVRVVLESNCNNQDHPEDWWLEPNQPWEYVNTLTVADLPRLTDQPPALWHSECDAVPAGYIQKMGQAAASLYLVKAPEKFNLTYHKEYNSFKRYDKKVRKLEFKLDGKFHEYSVTDPEFDRRFKLPVAVSNWPDAPQAVVVPNPGGCYVCLSLTPELNGRHYKICATLFES